MEKEKEALMELYRKICDMRINRLGMRADSLLSRTADAALDLVDRLTQIEREIDAN